MKPLLLGLILVPLLSSGAFAGTAGYCLECHSPRFVEAMDRDLHPFSHDDRTVYQKKWDPCPGLRSLSEEHFFTESRILRQDEMVRSLGEEGWRADGFKRGIEEACDAYVHLKDQPGVSIRRFSKEASAIRAGLQKGYDRAFQARDETRRRRFFGLSGILLLGFLVLLGLGYWKLGQMGASAGRSLPACLLVTVLTLAACVPGPGPPQKSAEQDRLERSLALAKQLRDEMEEAFYQSYLLAGMSRKWAKIDPPAAEKGFHLAWEHTLNAREKAKKIQSLKEIALRRSDPAKAVRLRTDEAAALDLQDEIRDTDRRTWGLRAVAEEWVQVNPKAGRAALDYATREAFAIEDDESRDRELKPLAEAWAGIDEDRSIEISRRMKNGLYKALAFLHALKFERDPGRVKDLLKEAWTAAKSAPPSSLRNRSLIRLAEAGATRFPQEKKEWLEQACLEIQPRGQNPLNAFALQDLVSRWAALDGEQAERWAMEIPPSFPEERAYALLHLARKEEASKERAKDLLNTATMEATKISDSFQARKLKGAIAQEMVRIDPSEALFLSTKMDDSLYRSEILGSLAARISHQDRKKGLELAGRIPLESFRHALLLKVIDQSLSQDRKEWTALTKEILQAVSLLSDSWKKTMRLLDLARIGKEKEREGENLFVKMALDSMEQITVPWLKIEAMESIAPLLTPPDRIKAAPSLNRIDPGVLRARNLLNEIEQWAPVDTGKAEQLAEVMSSNFPIEKAVAYREIAKGLTKREPQQCFSFLEKAMEVLLNLPAGTRGKTLLPALVAEMARLDREKTFRKLLGLEKREIRDALLKEAGHVWVQQDPPFAVKAAHLISEGSIRQDLYQRIADQQVKGVPSLTERGKETGYLEVFYLWGKGREWVKKGEPEASSYFEKALQEIKQIGGLREQTHLLFGLAADWALLDEERALRLIETVPADLPEPLSSAFLSIGIQLGKWNRKGAESVFQKALASSERIDDPGLKARRLIEIERQKTLALRGQDPALVPMTGVLNRLKQEEIAEMERDGTLSDFRLMDLLAQAKALRLRTEENLRLLENTRSFAVKMKSDRLISETALVWYSHHPEKGLEILHQVGSRKAQIETFNKLARNIQRVEPGEAKIFLEKALAEVVSLRGTTEQLMLLKEIAEISAPLDKVLARRVFSTAFQVVEKASPGFGP